MPRCANQVALFREFPALATQLRWAALGQYPTPIEALDSPAWLPDSPPLFIKREDLASPFYGGNKVRTLEAHLGRALSFGATEVWATGAYGSNHATATVIHAQRLGLKAGVMLWPQPLTLPARANMLAMLAKRPYVWPLQSVAMLPLGMAQLPKRARHPIYLMSPGGANTVGTLAHVSAGLEIAHQVRANHMPCPERILLAVGSTCTITGLLVGLQLAADLGIAFGESLPIVHGVRVTPWPITSRWRVAHFAHQTSRLLAHLVGRSELEHSMRLFHHGLRIDHRYLGAGYGKPTASGRAAQAAMAAIGGPMLDVVYSAKSAAAFFDLAKMSKTSKMSKHGPLLFWATKSTAKLPVASPRDIRVAPRPWQRWLNQPLMV